LQRRSGGGAPAARLLRRLRFSSGLVCNFTFSCGLFCKVWINITCSSLQKNNAMHFKVEKIASLSFH
jgi:hypothetical protein